MGRGLCKEGRGLCPGGGAERKVRALKEKETKGGVCKSSSPNSPIDPDHTFATDTGLEKEF